MRLRVIDLETTGVEPPAEVIELGYADVVNSGEHPMVTEYKSWLYRPLYGIPPEAKAVHHLTEDEFPDDLRPFNLDHLQAVLSDDQPDILVAHNCAFERKFLPPEVSEWLPWICTYKVALRLWPDAPGHSNQILRYWRNVKLDPWLASPPHRAGPDSWVTAHLLADMLRHASVEQMIAWTKMPKHMPRVPFGKHQGAEWSEIPSDYLDWMTRQTTMDEDAVWHAKQEKNLRLERRRQRQSQHASA